MNTLKYDRFSVTYCERVRFMQVVVYKILYIVLFLFCCVLYQVSDFSDLSAFYIEILLFNFCDVVLLHCFHCYVWMKDRNLMSGLQMVNKYKRKPALIGEKLLRNTQIHDNSGSSYAIMSLLQDYH